VLPELFKNIEISSVNCVQQTMLFLLLNEVGLSKSHDKMTEGIRIINDYLRKWV
jgi:hypothetical protein